MNTPENPALNPDWDPPGTDRSKQQRDEDRADADLQQLIDEGYLDCSIHEPQTKPYPGNLREDCRAVEPTEWQQACDLLQGLL